jgi:cytosine deaminase
MIDLLITNAMLPDGRVGLDIACASGLIAEIAPAIKGEALKTIDAKGYLVSPPFIDSHFHMDATLSLGIPRLNMSGTLLEGIGLWGELKPLLTHEAVIERALRYCDLAVSKMAFTARRPRGRILFAPLTSASMSLVAFPILSAPWRTAPQA